MKRKKTKKGRAKKVTPYVAERVEKLAPEHGWSQEDIQAIKQSLTDRQPPGMRIESVEQSVVTDEEGKK